MAGKARGIDARASALTALLPAPCGCCRWNGLRGSRAAFANHERAGEVASQARRLHKATRVFLAWFGLNSISDLQEVEIDEVMS